MRAGAMIRLGSGAEPQGWPLHRTADYARRRLKRIEAIGFGEVLLVPHGGALEDIERARDFL